MTGRYGTIGEVFFVEQDFWPLNTTLFVSDFHGHDPRFVAHLLRTIDFVSHSGKSGVPGVNRNDLHKLSVVIPCSIDEQSAIAAALDDVDATAALVEQLCMKKRDIKQATTQRLLTGAERLPGFVDPWIVTELGAVAEIVSGGTPSTAITSFWDGGIPWCTPTDVTSELGKYLRGTARTISSSGLESSGARLLPPGAILLCSRATVGEAKIATRAICTNQGFKSLIPRSGIDNEFLYYRVLTMKAQMIERAIGSTFLELSGRDAASLRLTVPSIDEQRAIAAVLSDMDAELAALERRLTKTRALKQSMMQELLTGRTRLT